MRSLCPVAPAGREVVREEGARSQAGLARWLEYEDATLHWAPMAGVVPGPLSNAGHCAVWTWKSHTCLMEDSLFLLASLPLPWALGRKLRAGPGRENPGCIPTLSAQLLICDLIQVTAIFRLGLPIWEGGGLNPLRSNSL